MKEMGLTRVADPQTGKTTASESVQEPGQAHRWTQKLEKEMELTPESEPAQNKRMLRGPGAARCRPQGTVRASTTPE